MSLRAPAARRPHESRKDLPAGQTGCPYSSFRLSRCVAGASERSRTHPVRVCGVLAQWDGAHHGSFGPKIFRFFATEPDARPSAVVRPLSGRPFAKTRAI